MRASPGSLVILALVVWGGVALAGEPPVPIEGKLMVGWMGGTPPQGAYLMEGSSDNRVMLPVPEFGTGDVSPLGDCVTYWVDHGDYGSTPIYYEKHIWKAGIDGSDPVNLTQLAGVSGNSCKPRFSPDGSQIAFQHADPLPGQRPCDAGWSTWIVQADGSSAHQVTPLGYSAHFSGCWSPNGYRLIVNSEEVYPASAFTIDSDGTDMQLLPNVYNSEDWSADGRKIVCDWHERGDQDGEPGWWRQLRMVDADGSNPEVLFEHFVSDATLYALEPDDDFKRNEIRTWIGPLGPVWSPRGDRIAFYMAYPFEPSGPFVKEQVDVWMYDVPSADLTKITADSNTELSLSWNGDNTFPDDPEVTVDNTTVTFGEVIADGLTTIIRDDDPPAMPTGYQFASEYYEISTTAEISGPIGICLTYRDEDIPSGTEETLAVYHYDQDSGLWEDITVSRDTEANVVCGQTDSLSLFGLSLPLLSAQFPDVPSTGFGPVGLHPHWAYYEVEACYDAGIVGGYPNGTYQPDWAVTRGQMAIYISRALAGSDDAVPTGPAQSSFADVPSDDICYKYIEYAHANEIVFGYPSDGLYHPEYDVDRGQMAVFVARATATPTGESGMVAYTPPATPTFADVTSDPLDRYQACYKYVEYIAAAGVTHGYDDGLYHPDYIVSRGLMAIYVARAFQLPM